MHHQGKAIQTSQLSERLIKRQGKKKRQETLRVARMWRKRSPRALLVECESVRPVWETVQFPQEISNGTYDAGATVRRTFAKETESPIFKNLN